MSTIDYDALRGASGGDPADGLHTAYLLRAALVHTQSGSRLVTEWQTLSEPRYYWTTWFGFEGNRLGFTQEFLDAAGIDRAGITDDAAFEQALSDAQGKVYEVRTEQGANWINTYITDAAEREVLTDAPIDTGDLPPVPSQQAVGAGVGSSPPPEDDDIPF